MSEKNRWRREAEDVLVSYRKEYIGMEESLDLLIKIFSDLCEEYIDQNACKCVKEAIE